MTWWHVLVAVWAFGALCFLLGWISNPSNRQRR
jgi:hypothetical protein